MNSVLAGHPGGAAGLEVQGVFSITERWDYDAAAQLFRTSGDYEM